MASVIANTIYQQIRTGSVQGCANGVHAMGCWGFNHPVDTLNGLKFKVNGLKHKGFVHVIYNEGSDLYDIDFYDRKLNVVKKLEMVYCDELTSIIDTVVEKGE